MSASEQRRPTEYAALRAVDRSPEPKVSAEHLLAALRLCQRVHDRAGAALCGHRMARALGQVIER